MYYILYDEFKIEKEYYSFPKSAFSNHSFIESIILLYLVGTFAETLYVRTWSDNITNNYYPSTINTTISYSFHQCVHSYYNRCTDINILSTNAWYDRSTVSPHTSLDKISDTHDRFSHFHLYC